MTEYPVQCFNNNGEPYGRYVNKNSKTSKVPTMQGYKEIPNSQWNMFESFAKANTFPFPSGTIGKMYERDEVEVVWQTEFGIDNWVSSDTIPNSVKNLGWYTERQIFCLIHQPVEKNPEIAYMERVNSALKATYGHLSEKEPDPLLSSRQYIEQVYGTSTFARSIECRDAESLMDMMDDFLDWGMQKKQEASR